MPRFKEHLRTRAELYLLFPPAKGGLKSIKLPRKSSCLPIHRQKHSPGPLYFSISQQLKRGKKEGIGQFGCRNIGKQAAEQPKARGGNEKGDHCFGGAINDLFGSVFHDVLRVL